MRGTELFERYELVMNYLCLSIFCIKKIRYLYIFNVNIDIKSVRYNINVYIIYKYIF